MKALESELSRSAPGCIDAEFNIQSLFVQISFFRSTSLTHVRTVLNSAAEVKEARLDARPGHEHDPVQARKRQRATTTDILRTSVHTTDIIVYIFCQEKSVSILKLLVEIC